MNVGDLTRQGQSDQLPKPYISFFTRDVSIGTGTQSITGLGFKPTAIVFFAVISNTDYASWGFAHSTQEYSLIHRNDTDTFDTGSSFGIRLKGAFDITGAISSIDTDGFTIQWTTQSGSPTGTATITYIAYK